MGSRGTRPGHLHPYKSLWREDCWCSNMGGNALNLGILPGSTIKRSVLCDSVGHLVLRIIALVQQIMELVFRIWTCITFQLPTSYLSLLTEIDMKLYTIKYGLVSSMISNRRRHNLTCPFVILLLNLKHDITKIIKPQKALQAIRGHYISIVPIT